MPQQKKRRVRDSGAEGELCQRGLDALGRVSAAQKLAAASETLVSVGGTEPHAAGIESDLRPALSLGRA